MDTFRTRKITVCPEELRASSKQLIKNSDIKIIGYYDMLGRQVEYVRPNEVYIYLYSNGERKKIIQIQY